MVMVLTGILFLAACSSGGGSGELDTYQSGTISIAADESLRPLVEAEVAVFCSTYQRATLKDSYMGEGDAVQLLLADSVRLIVIPRQLTSEETAVLEGQKIIPKYALVAYDALAVITNTDNPLPILSLDQLKSILNGSVRTWGDFEGAKLGKKDSIQLVVDFSSGSTVRYLVDSVMQGKPLPPNLYAAGGNENVINYIRQNRNALGIVGLAWISDQDDSTTQVFRTDIHVVELQGDTSKQWEYRELPNQYNIQMGQYPLARKIWVVHRDAHGGLGRGFEVFFAGEVGQRIALKQDLLPAQGYIRLVDTSKRSNW